MSSQSNSPVNPSSIYLGADHGGWELKRYLASKLTEAGHRVVDLGAHEAHDTDDYPVFAAGVAAAVAADPSSRGILICRSAAGVTIAANRLPGIRAVSESSVASATRAREHNDMNILDLSGDGVRETEAWSMVEVFLSTSATAGRHARRVTQIERVGQATAEVIPGIFQTTTEGISSTISQLAPLSEWLHVDVADGSFVPVSALADSADPATLGHTFHQVPCEVHLMVNEPAEYLDAWRRSGTVRFVVHIESPGASNALQALAPEETVLAIDLPTSLDALESYLAITKSVLVMGVKAGASGQVLQDSALLKIAELRERYPDLSIEVDGGVNALTAPMLITAGANRLTSTSYLANHPNPAQAMQQLANPWKRHG